MIKCLIIDDEPLAGQLLAAYAERSPDLEVVKVFSNPIEALHFLNDQPIDLLFLDIQMPELTGIQLMNIVRGKYDIILTTAYEEYALESYDFAVVDYLLKPISLDRFLLAVEKLKKRQGTSSTKTTVVSSPPEVKAKAFIFVKSGHKTVRVDFDELIRIESMSNYVTLYTPSEKIMTLENLGDLEEILPAERFVRVHRSHLVALDKINFVERNRIVIGETYIPISDSYKERFWKLVNR